jgi:hypothetical protein
LVDTDSHQDLHFLYCYLLFQWLQFFYALSSFPVLVVSS